MQYRLVKNIDLCQNGEREVKILDFKTYLKEHYILTDGAMGTYYGQLYPDGCRMSELANTVYPEQIIQIHNAYLKAGANLLRTNSFASNSRTLFGASLGELSNREAALDDIYRNVKASCQNAQMAVRTYLSEREGEGENIAGQQQIWIAGDIGPVPENGNAKDSDILAQYRVMADAMIDSGMQIILFETFADYAYIFPTIEYIKKRDQNMVIMVSFCLNKFGYTKMGLSAQRILEQAADSGQIDSVGFNCGIGSAHLSSIIKKLDLGDMIVSAVPNSGYPGALLDRYAYQQNTDYFCEHMKTIVSCGVNIVGGCCGTSPAYIQAMEDMLHKMECEAERDIWSRRIHSAALKDGQPLCRTKNDLLNKLNSGQKVIAVELDPPHDGKDKKIIEAAAMLKAAGADLITLSDSPMGKTRADSILTGMKIQNQVEIPVMPHICCRDRNGIAMSAGFIGAHMNGIRNMLIVTGDPVTENERNVVSSVYDFNSIRLMNFLQQLNQEHFIDDPIIYGGALNYGRPNIDKEIERMQKKCEAGADYFLTQPIYSDEDIERIRYIKEKIDTKILCGIMPLISYRNAMFMKHEIYGINVPDEVVARYRQDMSREEGEQTGIAIALELIEKMRNVADGYYFMVLFNRASMICKIMSEMKD